MNKIPHAQFREHAYVLPLEDILSADLPFIDLQVVFHDNDVHQFDLAELKSCKSNVSTSGVPGLDFFCEKILILVASCSRHFMALTADCCRFTLVAVIISAFFQHVTPFAYTSHLAPLARVV
jgi:hypothetical protein